MESRLNAIFFILSIHVLKSGADWVYDDTGCRTPDGGAGDCVIYKKCQSIMNYTKQFEELSEEQQQFLNGYRCGYSGKTVKMCCPASLNVPLEMRYNKIDLLPTECGISDYLEDKIIFGQEATLNEFPWMALLFYSTNKGPKFQCGGTIINERYILTAAHCIDNQLIYVRVGEHNVTSTEDCIIDRNNKRRCSLPTQDIKIEKKIPHKNFIDSQNDIALLRLSKPLNITTGNVKAICLPPRNSAIGDEALDSSLLVAGWGATENDSYSSDVLLKASVPIANRQECSKIFATFKVNISEKQFCFGGLGNSTGDSCHGDSGGPLQNQIHIYDDIRYTQLGIVSIGPNSCGYEGIPTIYTKVDQYIDWILENIKP